MTATFAAAGVPPVLEGRASSWLRSRRSMVARVSRCGRATRQAQERVDRLIAQLITTEPQGAARRLIATAGLTAVSDAISHYREGKAFAPSRRGLAIHGAA